MDTRSIYWALLTDMAVPTAGSADALAAGVDIAAFCIDSPPMTHGDIRFCACLPYLPPLREGGIGDSNRSWSE